MNFLIRSMKHICTYIIAALTLLAPASLAAEATDAVILHMTAGGTKIIPVEDAGEITFSGSQMNIGLLAFPLSDIVSYEFSEKSLAIEEIEGDLRGIAIDPRGYIDFSMYGEGSPVDVYGIDGIEHPFTLKDKVIDITHLPSGIYLIRIGKTSFRVLKK